MRKVVATTFVSIDGVMQAPGGPEEDTDGGFKFGGWTFHYWDEMMGGIMDEAMREPFDLLLGRKTYDIFAAHWPFMKDGPDQAIADSFNSITKYVASRSTPKLAWQRSQLLGSDVVAALRKLKAEDGPDLLVQGSGDFLQTLWKHGLVDELSVLTFPVLLGKGKRLFGDSVAPSGLKLVKAKSYPSGVIVANYVPDGDVKTGDFSLGEPSEAELERRRNLG